MEILIHSMHVIVEEHLGGEKENGLSHGVMVVIAFLDKNTTFALVNQTVISLEIKHGALKADETPSVLQN